MFLVGNCREEFEKFMNINAIHSVFLDLETSLRNAFDSSQVHALRVFGWLTQNVGQKLVLGLVELVSGPPDSWALLTREQNWIEHSPVELRGSRTGTIGQKETQPTGGRESGHGPRPRGGVTKFWVKQEEELVRARIFTDRLSIRRTKPGSRPAWDFSPHQPPFKSRQLFWGRHVELSIGQTGGWL